MVDGESIAILSSTCRTRDFISLPRAIRSTNLDTVIVLVYNARIHKAGEARRVADDLDIVLVYLPLCSSDLNPD